MFLLLCCYCRNTLQSLDWDPFIAKQSDELMAHIWLLVFAVFFPKKACACVSSCASFLSASLYLLKLLASFNCIWHMSSSPKVQWKCSGEEKGRPFGSLCKRQHLGSAATCTRQERNQTRHMCSQQSCCGNLSGTTHMGFENCPRRPKSIGNQDFLCLTAYNAAPPDFPLFKKFSVLTSEDGVLLWL